LKKNLKEEKNNMLLREKEIYPNSGVLKNLLGDVFLSFEELERRLVSKDMVYIWNYYNDGKAWLCKVQFKKKTVFWLSIWEGFFKIGFYFNEKNYSGIYDLDIDKSIISSFENTKLVGKFRPLNFEIRDNSQFEDIEKVIDYKISSR